MFVENNDGGSGQTAPLEKVFQCVYASYQSVLIHSAPFSKGVSGGQLTCQPTME